MPLINVFQVREENDRDDQTFFKATIFYPGEKFTSNAKFASHKGATDWADFIIAKREARFLREAA